MLSLSVSAFKTGTHTSHWDPELHVLYSAHILKWASHVWGLGGVSVCVSVSHVCVFVSVCLCVLCMCLYISVSVCLSV